MKEGYKSFMYYKFKATFSNVALIETEDPKRTAEMLNFFLKYDLWPWNFDYADRTIYDIITVVHDLIDTVNRARSNRETKDLTREQIEETIQRMHEKKHIKQIGENRYQETEKKPKPTWILHYDAWEGLRVNTQRITGEKPKWITWEQYQEQNGKKKEKRMDPLNGIFQKDEGKSRMDLETALNIIDDQAKTKRTVAILTGIIPSAGDHKELKTLATAVNNFAHNIQILNQESIIVIITPDRNILPQTSLNNVIFVRPPHSEEKERAVIIETLTNSYNLKEIKEKELIKALAGLTLHQCETILMESFFRTKRFKTEFISALKQEQVEKQGILQILNPGFGFERIGGYDSVKKFIKGGIIDVFQNPELADEIGLKPLRSVLLFGIWGSGKSLLAKALAHETKLPLFQFSPGSVYNKYVGETEKQTRKAIEMMEANAPCIIEIEEVDSLGHRSNTNTDAGTSRRVFGEFLDYTGDEDRKAIIFGTTNAPEYLDKAFLREGRFMPIPMLLPPFEARKAIFKVHLYQKRSIKTKFLEGPEGVFDIFAEKTAAFTGAEIEGVVKEAQRNIFNERRNFITEKDILSAIEGYNVEIEERIKVQNDYIAMGERICRSKQFLQELKREHAIQG